MIGCIYKLLKRIELKALSNRLISAGGGKINVLGPVYNYARKLKFGNNVTIYPNVCLWGNEIEIGNDVDLGLGTVIYGKKRVKIGNSVSIAAYCCIIDTNHGIKASQLIRKQEDDVSEDGVVIGDDVWIGAQCMIIKGAKIGNGAVIGANSLVNSEIPDNAIAYGSPAKVHGFRQ